MSPKYEILATDMDDIESTIAVNRLKDNIEFMAVWSMPKYTPDKVCGHCLYFTSFCTIEAMHVHAG